MTNVKKLTLPAIVERKKWGRGFTYKYEDGPTLKGQASRKWIQSLAIPPAWEQVKIDLDKSAKIHAWGRDSNGKKQYIYNKGWRRVREEMKFDRIIEFAQKLPMMRKITGQHLQTRGLGRKKVLACMVRLLDNAYFRAGNEHYRKENETYGLTTLRSKHLDVHGDIAEFHYCGKSHQEQHKKIEDKRLVKILKQLDEIPGHEIFKFFDEDGERIFVDSQMLNDYIKEIMGEDFSAKDFRTWAGTYLSAILLNELGPWPDDQKSKKNILSVIDQVASKLGNTRDVARASYIDPRVISSYESGVVLEQYLNAVSDCKTSSPEEEAVRELLKNSGKLYKD